MADIGTVVIGSTGTGEAGAAAIAGERSNSAMAKRVYEIVKRNGIIDTTIPPVPRLVMGNHA